MSAFFNSLKGDLLDRRLMPLLALLGAALLGAIVYAALASSGSSPATSASVTPPAPVEGIPVSVVKSENETGANETTNGVPKAGARSTHNPFTPLPEPKASAASKSATSAPASSAAAGSSSSVAAGSGSSSSGSSESSSSSGSSSKPASETPAKPKPKPQPKPKSEGAYAVSILLGVAAPGTPAPNDSLKLYEELKLQQPLPSSTQPLIVYRGATSGGASAAFTLVGEVIPHGNGQCLPSATQCQTLELKTGETEELEYVPLGGAAVNYELYVVAIEPAKKSGATAKGASLSVSSAGLTLLRRDGRQRIPGLRYSFVKGTLVPAGQHPLAALAARASWGTAASG
jgi:hypothetical protein